jgi:hypothetical protein
MVQTPKGHSNNIKVSAADITSIKHQKHVANTKHIIAIFKYLHVANTKHIIAHHHLNSSNMETFFPDLVL